LLCGFLSIIKQVNPNPFLGEKIEYRSAGRGRGNDLNWQVCPPFVACGCNI
jgi:hypothetical protein